MNILSKPNPQPGDVRICFAGDVFLGGEFLRYASKHGANHLHPFRFLKEEISKSDIFVLNLEGPISQEGKTRKGVNSILSNHRDIVEIAKWVPICVMNLANNHIMDYGGEGISETISVLAENKIYHVGAGKDINEASMELVVTCKGKTIGFMAFADDQPHVGSVIASTDSPGCASFRNLDEINRKIRLLRSKTDLVIVLLHWGIEHFSYPTPDQIYIAHRMVDAGASMIIGHHPHVLQGVEQYKGSLIAYSLGNLFLPAVRTQTGRIEFRKYEGKESILLNMICNKENEFDYDINAGFVSKNYNIIPYDDSRKALIMRRIRSLSGSFGTEEYAKFFKRYAKERSLELEKESFYEAVRKLYKMSPLDILRTFSIQDIKRNTRRVLKVIFNN